MPAKHSAVETVVLLHAIGRTSRQMRPLEDRLRDAGYEVLNLDYPAREFPIEELARHIHERIRAKVAAGARTHLVGCSLGALVARAVASRHRPPKLGRVVQLAPPNRGSEVADRLHKLALYRAFYGPAGQQLTTDPASRAGLFGPISFELGVIAGSRSIDPVSSWLIPGDDDGKVSIASTRLPGMTAHIVLPVTHTFIARNLQVQEQVLTFLQRGRFRRATPPAE